jgi:hypothetical protein
MGCVNGKAKNPPVGAGAQQFEESAQAAAPIVKKLTN